MRLNKYGLTLMSVSFCRRSACGTESKALLRSKNTEMTSMPWSRDCSIPLEIASSYDPINHLSRVLTDFDNLSSAVGVASNPSFPSQILFRSAWR